MQFFGISIYFLIDCTEKSLLCLFCATKVVIACAKIWHTLQQNVEIVNGGGKNQQGARKKILTPHSYNLMFLLLSFLLLDQKKRNKEKSRLWRLRCQKFVVSVSAKSNSLRSNSDLAFRHAQLDF